MNDIVEIMMKCNQGYNHFMYNLYSATKEFYKNKKIILYLDSTSWSNFSDYYTSSVINFSPYTENIKNNTKLIYASMQGGSWHWSDLFLSNIIELKPTIKHLIKDNIKQIRDTNYISMHVRVGDRAKDDYTEFLLECEKKIQTQIKLHSSKKILLVSDNKYLLNKYVDNKNIYSFGFINIPSTDSPTEKLHCLSQQELQNKNIEITLYERNLYTIVDFYMMLMSEKIIPSERGNFSKGAINVKENFIKLNKNIFDLI